MTRRFRFAVQATDLSDRTAVVAAAREAEDLGYEELFSYDHLGAVDPFVPLVTAAEVTSSLRVGPLVINNEFHHPALLARSVATADRLTGGRFLLGIGTGYARAEHEAMGVEYRRPAARVERLAESLEALRSLLDRGSAATTGTFHHLAVDDLGIRPLQGHLPILVGGHGRAVVQAAARWGDIVQFTGLSHGADGTPRASGFDLGALQQRAWWLSEAAGDRDPMIERSILVQRCVVGEGAGAAREQAVRRLGVAPSVVASTPFLLFGEAPEIVDRLYGLRDSFGVSHVVVREAAAFAPVVAALRGR